MSSTLVPVSGEAPAPHLPPQISANPEGCSKNKGATSQKVANVGLAIVPHSDCSATTAHLSMAELKKNLHVQDDLRSVFFLELKNRTDKFFPQVHNFYLRSQFDYPQEYQVVSRYPNIECPKNTAVRVGDKFLHANYVTDGQTERKFIASQSPSDFSLFWKFIAETDFNIIDLDNEENMCYPLAAEEAPIFGEVSVTLTHHSAQSCEEAAYEYLVDDLVAKTSRTVIRYHYKVWEDGKTLDISKLSTLVEKLETTIQGNTLVHCKAGVGRTGTLLTAYFLKQKIIQGKVRAEDIGNTLVDLIDLLRHRRGPHFVQTKAQFDLLLDYGFSLMT